MPRHWLKYCFLLKSDSDEILEEVFLRTFTFGMIEDMDQNISFVSSLQQLVIVPFFRFTEDAFYKTFYRRFTLCSEWHGEGLR
jgi:hypothetical protein